MADEEINGDDTDSLHNTFNQCQGLNGVKWTNKLTEECNLVDQGGTTGVDEYETVTTNILDISNSSLGDLDKCDVTEAVKLKSNKSITEERFCSKVKRITAKLKSDQSFRRKSVYSVALIWSFFILGWMLGQVGPTLLDLELITGVSLETAAFYVTSLCAGYMAGSLLSGLLYHRINKFLQIWIFLTGLAVSTSLIPWCVHYIGMLFVQFVVGIFQGCIDTVSCAEMVAIWDTKTSQSFMQALHFGFATGGIISPLVSAPFLAERRYKSVPLHSTINVSNSITSTISNDSFQNITFDTYSFSNSSSVMLTSEPIQYEVSYIHIAYGITGALSFCVSLPFLIMFFRIKRDFERHGDEGKKRSNKPLPVGVKVVILINMCALSALYTGLEETFVEFLSAFCVEQVKWTKKMGSIATSIYFGSIGFGHFINIFTVRLIDQVKLMGGYCCMLILTMIWMTLSSENILHYGVWISPPLVGLSLSIIYPIIFTWTEDVFLPVTGRVSSLFILTGALGSMINPIILGVLMDEYNPMWFCYVLLTESILQFLFYLSGCGLQKFVQSKYHESRTTADLLQGNKD